MKPWVKKSERVEKVGYRTIVHKLFELPNGKDYEFTVLEKPGVCHVATIALTKDNKIIIVREFRPGPEKFMDEIPGGSVEPGEDLAEAAARELSEEAGYLVGTITSLGEVHKDAYNSATWHYFFAEDCVPSEKGQQLEETEFAEVMLISVEELIEGAKMGRMTDTEAVFLAYDKLKKIAEGTND